ncbi:MAG: endonuclease MutS2 [Clostridia bacterium]|nr:endonuclease MutS2 [Clostridia bacterium]
MQNIYLEKLEFNKITAILSGYSVTSFGKLKCKQLCPMTDSNKIQKALSETTEAVSLLYRKGIPPIDELNNIETHILNLKNQKFLSIKSLLEITKVLTVSRKLKDYYFEKELNQSDSLTTYFDHLYLNIGIEEKISSSILDEQTLNDYASSELYNIRTSIKSTQKEIKARLQSLLTSKYLQDPIITIRQNRFVVPVKSEYQANVKGFIHDTSTSGSTVFIEPLTVFDLNNKLSDLQIKENIEIEKILQKLSSLFFEITNELENNYNLIAILDFIFAKAKYSKATNSNCPQINNNKTVYLKNAIHPLLNPETAVPITLEIGKTFSSLLITGPNTGGKTVTLKTVGLLVLMASSGMHIPASSESSIFIFDNIFADIGDEQSILESLSTFSSHMSNIVNIVNKSTSNSLVLVDELGSGTDPIEGASLAQSILEYLKEKNILTIATTHYQNLKEYALLTEGVENASCEFNLDTLSPTYRLLLGVPGKSNAFAISQKLGLNSSILENAKKLINEDTATIEDLLKEIYDSKALIETEKEKILQDSEKISILKEKLENEQKDISEHKKEYIKKAKQDAKEILLQAKQDANEIIKEMEHSKNDNKKLNNLRNKLGNKLSETTDLEKEISNDNPIEESEIKPNTIVYIPSFDKNGTILSYPNQSKKVNIQIDNIKTNLHISELSKVKSIDTISDNIIIKKHSNFSPKKVETELNIIGLNIEESTFLVDKFLDNAVISKLENVRIVHGKGTGALGKGIQNYLKSHPHVKSFRYGTFGEGEMGVTIVELK